MGGITERDLTIEGRLTEMETRVQYLEEAMGGINTKLDKLISNGNGKKTTRWMIMITIMNVTLMIAAIGVIVALQIY